VILPDQPVPAAARAAAGRSARSGGAGHRRRLPPGRGRRPARHRSQPDRPHRRLHGLHAGWVWVIQFVRESSRPVADQPLGWLVSDFDGVVGWLVLAWTLVIGALLLKVYRKRPSPRRA
jgi:hypothetical protein